MKGIKLEGKILLGSRDAGVSYEGHGSPSGKGAAKVLRRGPCVRKPIRTSSCPIIRPYVVFGQVGCFSIKRTFSGTGC